MSKRKKPEPEPGTLDAAVINKLTSKKAHERAEAEETIEALGPEAVDALLASLKKEGETRVRRRKIGIGVLVGMVAMMIILAATGAVDNIGSFSGMTGAIISLFAVSQTQKNAARALARFDDIREVGPLAEALFYDDKETAKLASEALLKLLPRLQASDAHLLNDAQRTALRNAVKREKPEHETLSLAILKAYEQVGDDKDLPAVEGLAERTGTKPHLVRVQAAARDCLPFLEKRAEQARIARTLLRPASGPDDLAAVLLRPVDGSSDTGTATLVRPAECPAEAASAEATTEELPASDSVSASTSA